MDDVIHTIQRGLVLVQIPAEPKKPYPLEIRLARDVTLNPGQGK